MNTLLAVVLLCAATVPGSDCTRDTARDVVSQPVALITDCTKVGQHIAAEAFGALPEGHYAKVACERRKG